MEDTHVTVLVIILFNANETNKCCCCYIVRVWRSPAQYCLQMIMVASSSAFFIAVPHPLTTSASCTTTRFQRALNTLQKHSDTSAVSLQR